MSDQIIDLLIKGVQETLYMVIISTLAAYIIGIPLGIIVFITDKKGIRPNRIINFLVGIIINVLRSVPFLILLVAIIPFTRLIALRRAPLRLV